MGGVCSCDGEQEEGTKGTRSRGETGEGGGGLQGVGVGVRTRGPVQAERS